MNKLKQAVPTATFVGSLISIAAAMGEVVDTFGSFDADTYLQPEKVKAILAYLDKAQTDLGELLQPVLDDLEVTVKETPDGTDQGSPDSEVFLGGSGEGN